MSAPYAMFQAIEFIEAHLKEELSVAAVAEAVGHSLYHFCRTFNAAVHHTPYDYLMRRRLSEAARSLVETDQKIIDIAFEHKFDRPPRLFGVGVAIAADVGNVFNNHILTEYIFDYMLTNSLQSP